MARYRLIVSYQGGAFHGWQLQPGLATIQGAIEQALAALLRHPVRVLGASRTDAGVHARGQAAGIVAAADLSAGLLVHGTNRLLPQAVRIMAADPAPTDFHPRYDALGKEYRYRLIRAEALSPLDSDRAVCLPPRVPFDAAALAEATALLVGEHDFAAFALAGGAHTDTRRRIDEARWELTGERLELVVIGNGFLRGMIRSLVGTLLEVARGRREPESLARLLTGAPRSAAGETAPPHGLCLERVLYPVGLFAAPCPPPAPALPLPPP